MLQKSRIAPPSDLWSLRRQGRAGGPHPIQATLKHVLAAVVLAGAFYALPKIFGPALFHDKFNGAMAGAAIAGEWVRTALVVAFESIPVR